MAAGLGTEITLVTITVHLRDQGILVIIMNSGPGRLAPPSITHVFFIRQDYCIDQ